MAKSAPIPRKIGEYRIIRLLGEGGMGRVLLAETPKTRELVAIKHIHLNLLRMSNYRQRFEREMEIMQNLSHPNLMPLLHQDEVQGVPYYVMPYIDGLSIRDYVQENGAFMPEQALPVVEGVCSALTYMHNHSVYHRDIKPHNIIVDREGKPYLTDFGIAADYNANTQLTNTIQRAGLGTDGYVAPELRGGAFASPRTDVYSLGMTVYEMFAQQSLYEKLSEDVSNPFAPVPESLHFVIKRAIAQTPKFRYQTIEEFLNDFQNAVQQEIESFGPVRLEIPAPRKKTNTDRTNTNALPPLLTSPTGFPEESQTIASTAMAVVVTMVALVIVGMLYFGARQTLNSVAFGVGNEPTGTPTSTPTITSTPEDTPTPTATSAPTETSLPSATETSSATIDATGTFEAAFFSALTATAAFEVAQEEQTSAAVIAAVGATRVNRTQVTNTPTATRTEKPTQQPTDPPTERTVSSANDDPTPEGIPYEGLRLFVQRETGLYDRVSSSEPDATLTAGTSVTVVTDGLGNTYFDYGAMRYFVVRSLQGVGWVKAADLGVTEPILQQVSNATISPVTTQPTVFTDVTDTPESTAETVVLGVGMAVVITQEIYAVNLPGSTIGVDLLLPGMMVSIVDGPREANSRIWWRIRTPSGSDGWIDEAALTLPGGS